MLSYKGKVKTSDRTQFFFKLVYSVI
jgi:hypothetical protein